MAFLLVQVSLLVEVFLWVDEFHQVLLGILKVFASFWSGAFFMLHSMRQVAPSPSRASFLVRSVRISS